MNLNYVAIDYMSVAKGGKGGLVANVASLSGIVPFPLCVAYCATKHGIVGLTRSLGVSNIKVNTSNNSIIKFTFFRAIFT